MNHWPFVAGAYAIFFIGFAADALIPGFRRRRLITRLGDRWRREQTRLARHSRAGGNPDPFDTVADGMTRQDTGFPPSRE